MLYNNSFEYAAIVIALAVQLNFLLRHATFTRSSRVFFMLTIIVELTAITDVISSYTISYPRDYSLAFNYTVSAAYTVLFTGCMFIFLLYTDSLTKIPGLKRKIDVIVILFFVYQLILNVTGQWTHLGVYFDENLNYVHGTLHYLNYVMAAGALVGSIIMVFKGRVRFSVYQKVSLVIFSTSVVIAIAIQFFNPSILLGGFVASISVLFLMMAFENPAYYFYRETRCQNRDAFFRLSKERRKAGKKDSLILLKIENYSNLSSQTTGTQMMNITKEVADRLSHNFRGTSFVMGADRFLVASPDTTENLIREMGVEESLKALFKEPLALPGHQIKLEMSTAILPFTEEIKSGEELAEIINTIFSNMVLYSDLNAYERLGKIIEDKKRLVEVVRAVEKAIANNSFKVFYQPIFNVKTKEFETAEALVRLIDDEIGFVSPEEFIPITEENGLISSVGDIVFKKVCEFMCNEENKKLGIKYIEVNLSPVQCQDPELSDRYLSIMKEYGIKPGQINFEITETAKTEFADGSTIVNNIIKLNKMGVEFSLDDFGSGFAAMDYLFKLPVELVKVDKSILWQAMKDNNAMIVLRNTLKMVSDLKKKVLVEGVEDEQMVKILEEMGCNYMQGYYYSKPVPPEDYVSFLKSKM